jgi:3-deoxy-D-manno-octulosonic-acid transferase
LRAVEHSLAALSAIAAAPVAVGLLAARPSWRVGIRERLGALMSRPPGAIWIHGASVGEILAASRLVDQLRRAGGDVFTSTATVSGRDLMRRTRPEVPCQLAPLDHPWCVNAALDCVSPAALVLVESELWPTWIAASVRREIPVVLVSGRVSDRAFARYRRLGGIAARTLRRLTAIGARTAADADRFRALGADPSRVSVTGDLKIDSAGESQPIAAELDRVIGATPLFVAGSTHPGEEVAVLAAMDAIERAGLGAALILAPRQIERVAEVERLSVEAGRTTRRRSALSDGQLGCGDVLVLDTMGELASLYSRADVAFVGGSLVPVGGHNILEPALVGCPVVFGRHTGDIRHAVEILAECGAGRCVADAAGLGRAVVEVLGRPTAALAEAQRGKEILLGHCGSTERAGALIESALSESRQRTH